MPDQIDYELKTRKDLGTERKLLLRKRSVDFYSNDYLGLTRNKEFEKLILGAAQRNPECLVGVSGSRLISGNTRTVMDAERKIAAIHGTESALLFPSGYLANLSIVSALSRKGNTIIVDELIHRSVHDGCRMGFATKYKFRHNDLSSLESKLKLVQGRAYVIVESLYSMEGDMAPLADLIQLSKKYQAGVIVDEAHAFGVFGLGLVNQLGLQNEVLATVITYGKAMGLHGAAVLSGDRMKHYLINFSSPFIYSTGSPDIQWLSIISGYGFLERSTGLVRQLKENIRLFVLQRGVAKDLEYSHIQSVLVPGVTRCRKLASLLSDNGYAVVPIFSPTVQKGKERIRICIHSFNTEEEIIGLTSLIRQFFEKS